MKMSAWVVAALVGLAPTAAYAVGGPSPGAVSAQTVKLPAGPGSVRGLADDAQVSAFTGQVQYAVPIDLPDGLGGATPSLSLGYAGELGNGPLGVGWTLTQPGIRRSLRLGVPRYDATDELELVGLGGSGELVRLADGTFRVEGEGHSYVGREVTGGFELVDADGTTYRFGITATARKGSGAQVSFWNLEEVVDVAGHRITYQYRQADGEVYLEAIAWGPDVSGAPAFRADLVYGTRGDTVVSYRTGFRVATAERLEQVVVWSFGMVQRVVELSYDETFALTRLAGVEVTSADGQESLPPLTFHYATPTPGAVEQVSGLDGWALNQAGTSLFDVDDDGVMDLMRLTTSGHSYRRNLGGSFDVVRPVPGATGAALDNVRLLDLTGDSGAEMVWQQGAQWKVFQLDGTDVDDRAWTARGTLTGTENLTLSSVSVADLDGDYRMDFLSTYGTTKIAVRMGTGTGLEEQVRMPLIDPARTYIKPGNSATSFPDINGDGLADVAYTASTSLYLYLGRGDGSFEKYRDVAYPWSGTIDLSQLRLGDLDRDGLLDIAVVKAGNVAWYRGEPNGTFVSTAVELPRPPGTDASVVVTLADANGNGSEDVVWSSTAGLWVVDLAGPTSAGMLVSIENGLGQTQSFTYEASAQLAFDAADAGDPWTTRMPVSIPVTVGNRRTLASGEPPRSTRLDVRNGLYDPTERRFLGFELAIVTRPDPADGAPASQTVRHMQQFHRGIGADRALRGQVVFERLEDGAGHVYRETTYDVAAAAVFGLPATDPRLARAIVRAVETRHYEGRPTALVTRIEYVHDAEGRVLEERTLGRLDVDGDESILRRRYTGTSSRGVRDKVCEEWLLEPDGAGGEILVSHTQTLFGDHLAVAALCDASAGIERVERAELLGPTPRWIEVSHVDVDAHGNPLRSVKGGVVTELEYDAYGLHPVAEIVWPEATRSIRWEATWDNVQGQPRIVREPTGVAVEATYDGLGRVTALARVGAQPHVQHRYHWAGPRPSVETFTYDGDLESVTALPSAWTPASRWRRTIAVSNSAAEPLFEATALDADRWIVSSHRTRDAHGRTTALADAFEWTGTVDALPGATVPSTTAVRAVAYDGLDRMTQQTLATGAKTTYAYRAFGVVATTDGKAPVTTELDGAQRIRRTTRVVGGITEAVDAEYDAAGRLESMRIDAGATAVEHAFAYDSLGQLVFATDPDIGDRHLAYDDAGRVVAVTNAAGQTIAYSYDGAGRLATTIADDGSTFRYHYDLARDAATFGNTAGRLAWVEEPTGTVDLGYDALGRTVRTRRTVHGHTAEERMRYGASGLLLSIDQGDGVAIDYTYDAAGRAIGVGDLWQLEAQDAAGRILRERFGNGVVQTYQRDVIGQATRIGIVKSDGTAIHDASVAYNAYGAITAVTDHDGVGLDHTAAFTYDGAARLTEALVGQGAAQFQFRYQYDGLQNMIRREAHGPRSLGILTGAYVYGGAGAGPRQLTSVVPDDGTAPTTFDYDDAGRMTRQGALALDYNGFDQLVRVTGVPGGTGTVEHAYGYDGLRVFTRGPDGAERIWFSPSVSQTDDGVREHVVRLGDRLIARITYSPTAATAHESAHIVGLVQVGIAGAGVLCLLALFALPRRRRRARAAMSLVLAVAIIQTGCGSPTGSTAAYSTMLPTLFYHQVVGAGPTIITTASGDVFEERRYEPFGAPIDADLRRDPHNILNKETDPETGWSDHGARWMAPETGRWLTPDPPVKAPDPTYMASPWELHPYQHVEQNPVLYWDPDGRDAVAKNDAAPLEAEKPKKMPKSIATETRSFGMSDGPYGWTASYDIGMKKKTVTVTVKIKLTRGAGVTARDIKKLKKEWTKAGAKWSGKFKLVDKSDAKNSLKVKVNIKFVDDDEHHEVTVQPGPARSDMGTWDTKDDKDAASHEVGHMMGNPDEYADATSPTRTVTDATSVMHTNTGSVQKGHYQGFADWLSDKTGREFEVK